MTPRQPSPNSKLMLLRKVLETVLFSSRWILPIFYIILMLALMVYAYFDIKEFVEYISHLSKIDRTVSMITFIELIDMTMIANLGKYIVTGSYNSFVSKQHGYPNENISSGLLKVKMSTSLVGVTAIALLQRSIYVENVSWDTLLKLGFIHGLFLIASIILEAVEYLHMKSELEQEKFEHSQKHKTYNEFTNQRNPTDNSLIVRSGSNASTMQATSQESKNNPLQGSH